MIDYDDPALSFGGDRAHHREHVVIGTDAQGDDIAYRHEVADRRGHRDAVRHREGLRLRRAAIRYGDEQVEALQVSGHRRTHRPEAYKTDA